VVYATSLRPFDAHAFRQIVGDDPTVVTVEPLYAGTATAVVVDALAGRRASVHSIGVPRAFIDTYGTAADLDARLGLDAPGLRSQLEQALGR